MGLGLKDQLKFRCHVENASELRIYRFHYRCGNSLKAMSSLQIGNFSIDRKLFNAIRICISATVISALNAIYKTCTRYYADVLILKM